MAQWIRNLLAALFGYFFDLGEFIAGILLGLLLAWGARRLSPTLDLLTEWYGNRSRATGKRKERQTFDRYRVDLIAQAQSRHLANPLFALDEIVVTPRLQAPPLPEDSESGEHPTADTLSVIPNLPDWNFLSGIYAAPSITLADALADGANLLITGRLGSGKSTALAYLAIRIAMRDSAAGALVDYTPAFIHAADLVLDRGALKEPLKPVVQAVQQGVSSGVVSRVPGQLQSAFKRGQGVLLLDGLDEFTADEISAVSDWLEAFIQAYPKARILAAGPVSGYDGLARLGLVPIPIAAWTEQDQRVFLRRWAAAWQEHIAPTLPKGRLAVIDPALINGWLAGALRGHTPLEITLRTWGAYVGDLRGGRASDALEAYIARFLSPDECRAAQASALAWIKRRSGILTERELHRGTPASDMIAAGLLRRHVQNRLTFTQPSIGAYLAARSLSESGWDETAAHLGWLPSEATLRYYASFGDLQELSQRVVADQADPLQANLLTLGSFLRDSPPKMPWRAEVLRRLATIATDPKRSYGLRLRAVHVLASSQDPSVAVFFRRLLAAENPGSCVLGSLGLGGLGDPESIKPLLEVIEKRRSLHTRQAACLALAAIATEEALESLGRILLEGDESVQIAAAEALACNPDEGYSMLRDAIEVQNLLTRRAAVFGLGRIREEWVTKILEQVQLEDEQWVVRGAAAEVLERRRNPPWKVRAPMQEISQLPWLQDFAAREGLAVAPGRAALEMVRRALNKGKPEEQIAALEAIAWMGGEELSLELFQALRSSEPHLRDAAFEALWQLSASGVDIASLAPA